MSIRNNCPLLFIFLSFLVLLIACQQEDKGIQQTLAADDIKKEKAFLANIQHPAGASSSHSFLPYPANHGNCNNNPNLEVITLAPQLSQNDKVAVYPIATLLLTEAGQERPILITSPVDTALQIVNSTTYQQFLIQQVGMRQILQDWFLYEKGLGKVELIDWKDERYAWKLINNEQ